MFIPLCLYVHSRLGQKTNLTHSQMHCIVIITSSLILRLSYKVKPHYSCFLFVWARAFPQLLLPQVYIVNHFTNCVKLTLITVISKLSGTNESHTLSMYKCCELQLSIMSYRTKLRTGKPDSERKFHMHSLICGNPCFQNLRPGAGEMAQ